MKEEVLDPGMRLDESASDDQVREHVDARVLVVFGTIPLLGHERGNIQVFNALKQRGVDALFVTHKEYGHEMIQPELDRLGHRWTAATFPRRFSRGMRLRTWATRLRDTLQGMVEFWKAGRVYEPTHVHAGHMMYFLIMLPAIRLLGVPVVYRVGDAPARHRPLFRFLWRRVIIPNVDHFVCISEYIRGLVIEAGADPHKIRVIYNCPPVRPPASPEPLPEAREGRTVLYMGQLSEEKGVGLLVEAAIRLCAERKDLRFLLAGDYTWQNPFAEALIEHVEALGLSERIRFLGYVEDVPGLLAAADVHVCPSVWEEPLSNVVPEAKQAGVPSVVFPSGGLPELIEHEVDGWICDAKTADSLKHALDRMLSLPDSVLRTMGEEAQASMERLGITERTFTDAWVKVYKQAAAGAH